jgi:hypothetical protein
MMSTSEDWMEIGIYNLALLLVSDVIRFSGISEDELHQFRQPVLD